MKNKNLEFNNNSEKISANEINKYTFCPYQWYYERLYGTKYIRQKLKERNENLNLKDTNYSNFKKGLKFHNNYILKRKFKILLKIFILILIIFLILKLWMLKFIFY